MTTPPKPAPFPTPVRPRSVIRPGAVLGGMAAVTFALLFVATLAWSHGVTVAERYQAEADARLKSGDFAGAQTCLKRLLALDPLRVDTRVKLAETEDRLGRPAAAEALIRTIAPPDRLGYEKAHLWLAQRLIAAATVTRGPASAARVKEAEAHLRMLYQKDPKNLEYMFLLGGLLADTGRPADAIRLLVLVAPGNPLVGLKLADCEAAIGKRDEAANHRKTALADAQKLAEAKPNIPEAWVIWSKVAGALGDLPGAASILVRGQEKTKSAALKPLTAAAYARWATSTYPAASSGAAGPGLECFGLIEKGLAQDPTNEELINLLKSFLTRATPAGDAVRAALENRPADDPVAVPLLVARGNYAWGRGDRSDARALWQRAYDRKPDFPLLLNNLSWAVAFTPPEEPERGLKLADELIALAPGDVRFRTTRGQILNKLGRWQDAADELERAALAGVRTDEVREALELAYTKLNHPEKITALRSLFTPRKGETAAAAPPPAAGPG